MPLPRTARLGALCLLAACALPGALPRADAADWATPRGTLAAYRSEAEFRQALTRWRDEARQRQRERRRELSAADAGTALPASPAPLATAQAGAAARSAAEAAAESITNVQTAGVDEGGIVKRAGEHLVILRRGRLFTVRVGGDTLQPAAMVDAYAPGSNPDGAWYDELLIAGNTVVVIGYSYARGGTEIGLFELGRDGSLAYRSTWHLRSFDYYSSRNYASRLVDGKLVFYTPSFLQPWAPRPWDSMPGLRRWRGDATPPDFERILPATRIYRSDDDFDADEVLALHTVTACDLADARLRCESTAVLGPAGRVFYVSQGAVYVWTSASRRRHVSPHEPRTGRARDVSAVFRMPLSGAAPSGIRTAGVPIDQMSFLEDAGEHLNVLLRQWSRGEGMWGSESTHGAMALLRLPLAAFGDGRSSAQPEHYRMLPAVAGHAVQNRFVGDWLLWGGAALQRGPGVDREEGTTAWAVRYADGGAPQALSPAHGIERIEALGRDALLVGNQGSDLHFSSVRLQGGTARLAGRYVQAGARQGETRTHGFFFRPTGEEEGLLGLPVLEHGAMARHGGVFHGAQGSAAVLYLRQRELSFTALGGLRAQPASARDDGCKASCVDWYGNARPIFLGERVFALLGYELVEGVLAGGRSRERIEERRRISFAPHPSWQDGRYSPFN